VLTFSDDTSSTVHNAVNAEVIANPFAGVGASGNVGGCSFAGGCEFNIAAAGLSSLMKADPTNNYVKVCGNTCEFNEAASDATSVKCRVPALSTLYSDVEYSIQKSRVLKGSASSSYITEGKM
jgi:hypothetical protein